MTQEAPRYSHAEEIASSIVHGVGTVLAVLGLALLAVFAARDGGARDVVAVSVFGSTLILLYAVSTLYHGLSHPRAKRILRAVDHSAIFLLIAGTYTPFTLLSLRGPWGWSLFGVVWGIAVLGIALRLALRRRPTGLFVGLYVGLGWCAVVATRQLLARVEPAGLVLLLAGGIAYTAGVIFYLWHRLPFHHAIWHVFVLGGSVLHYFSILFFVLPSAVRP